MPVAGTPQKCWPAIGYRGPIRQADGLFSIGFAVRCFGKNVWFAVGRHGDRPRHGKHRRLRERARYRAERAISRAIASVRGRKQVLAVGEEAKLDARPHFIRNGPSGASRMTTFMHFTAARYTPRAGINVTAIFRYFGMAGVDGQIGFPTAARVRTGPLRWRGSWSEPVSENRSIPGDSGA